MRYEVWCEDAFDAFASAFKMGLFIVFAWGLIIKVTATATTNDLLHV